MNSRNLTNYNKFILVHIFQFLLLLVNNQTRIIFCLSDLSRAFSGKWMLVDFSVVKVFSHDPANRIVRKLTGF